MPSALAHDSIVMLEEPSEMPLVLTPALYELVMSLRTGACRRTTWNSIIDDANKSLLYVLYPRTAPRRKFSKLSFFILECCDASTFMRPHGPSARLTKQQIGRILVRVKINKKGIELRDRFTE